MVGGDSETYEKALPLFEKMGKTITHQGAVGSGQHTKMANQICIAGTMTGMTELLAYAQKAGLDLDKVLNTVGEVLVPLGLWLITVLGFSVKIIVQDFC